ncbi:MAG: restriction endonuclease subunit S [Eubacterium sp.]|nr:restriction endonuclease subunit S [Eubacterium sp.]
MNYKNSGIDFIGVIPETWIVRRGKNILTLLNKPVRSSDEVITCFRDGQVTLRSNRRTEGFTNAFKEIGYQGIDKGDLVVHGMDGFAGAIGISDSRGKGSPVLNVMDSNQNKKFIMYYLRGMAYRDVFMAMSTGIRERSCNLQWNKLAVFPFVFPNNLVEQSAIADYLDERCAKIDAIIDDSKKSIEEYKELKQAVIYEAVTKGLDKNVEMKDSGYDFIGRIPKHWRICKVRHIGTLQNGISKGGDSFGKGYPFVSYVDVYKNYSLPENVNSLVDSNEDDRRRYSVESGDIFFTRTSETIDEIGFSCVCKHTIPNATFAGFLIRLRPFNDWLDTNYAKYYFRSPHLRNYFVKEMNLVIRASLGQTLLKGAPLLLPPLNEQIRIGQSLDKKCSSIDNVISDKLKIIADLESYKKSLIYEVVTGKRRVV